MAEPKRQAKTPRLEGKEKVFSGAAHGGRIAMPRRFAESAVRLGTLACIIGALKALRTLFAFVFAGATGLWFVRAGARRGLARVGLATSDIGFQPLPAGFVLP